MIEYVHKLLGASGLAPHGYCLLWDPALIWTHVIADALIGISYYSIPFALAMFLTKRPDVRFRGVAWLFVVFILACGTTHFISIWTLWYPDYGPEALVKMVTAVASVVTAVALWPLLPRALALPSPAQLQRANDELRLRIGERDSALAALAAETQERERAETMLRQAQKLEAIGQLTGGIAHDFNNMLTVIIANLDRARRRSDDNPALTRPIDSAIEGAERAARMTDQLLAFARRQPLRPERQDLNGIVERVSSWLATTLGPDIGIETQLAAGLWPVCIDGSQAESALLNLAVNARDAMPQGGKLQLTTRNEGADRVVVEVCDTGFGMDAATQERAFEPFFTTKPTGEGTGLGLSQVYGFTSQSDGEITIESTPGKGTCVRITLPRAA